MKNILLIIGLLIGLISFGQPGYQKYPTRGEFISLLADSSIHIPKGCGKPLPYTSVNTKNWKYGFALYGDTCNKHMYFYTDSTWFLLADSIWSDIRYLANTIQCGLTCSDCGRVIYTGTGMNYYVSPAYYNIDFVPYFFAGDSVTLADGDATFDRFDAIVLTATGVDTIQGIPTSDPQLPQFDPCANILLTYVLVTAGTTTPAQVSDEVIYDENVETWTHTTGGTISANFAGTAQVFHGTKSITISSWSNNSYINFLGPSSYINSNYSTLSFWVRLTAIMVNNQNVSVQFFNNTTAVSNQVVGQITKGNITTYQSVAFNMSQFTFTSPTFNTVRIQFSGSQSNTFYLDWVRLQAGIVQPPAPTGLNNAYTRVTDGTTTTTAIGGDIFKLRANAPLHATVTNNDATHGDNALFTVDTLRSTANSLATNGIVKKQIDSLAGTISSVNIYNSDGTLTGNRTVNGDGRILEIDSTTLFNNTSKTLSGKQSIMEVLGTNTKLSSVFNASGIAEFQTSANNPFSDGKDVGISMRVDGGGSYNSYYRETEDYINQQAEHYLIKTTSSGSIIGERYLIEGTYKTLTESSATPFVRVNIPTSEITGGEILITVEAKDATDFQARTLRFIWSAVNKAGTLTITVQTPEEVVAVSTGTLTVTIDTNDAGSGNLDFRANAVSSLTQTTLRCSYQIKKNIGTGVITSQ